jgi:hypothetical protein
LDAREWCGPHSGFPPCQEILRFGPGNKRGSLFTCNLELIEVKA